MGAIITVFPGGNAGFSQPLREGNVPGNVAQQLNAVPNPSNAAAVPKPVPATTNGAFTAIDLALSDLKKRGASRPRKVSTLTSTIKALLKQQLKPNSDAEVANLIAELQKRGRLITTDTTSRTN